MTTQGENDYFMQLQTDKAELSSLSAFMTFRVQTKLMCREANAPLKGGLNRTLLKGGLNRTLGVPFGYKVKLSAKAPGSREKGFTLLELLVALAILSLVALTALNNNTNMVSNAEYLRDKTLAHWVAMNQAGQIRLVGGFIDSDGAEGVEIMGERRWSWRATGQSTPDPDLQLVEIEVWPGPDRKGSRIAFLNMYLGR